MSTHILDDDFDHILKSHNTGVKIHTIRKFQDAIGSANSTIVEVDVWRPVGSFQLILNNDEIARYGKPKALDRCLRAAG